MFNLVEDYFEDENGHRILAYSICSAAHQFYLSCVSSDRAVVERLVQMLNSGKIAPCHLHDVIEDYISALYIA